MKPFETYLWNFFVLNFVKKLNFFVPFVVICLNIYWSSCPTFVFVYPITQTFQIKRDFPPILELERSLPTMKSYCGLEHFRSILSNNSTVVVRYIHPFQKNGPFYGHSWQVPRINCRHKKGSFAAMIVLCTSVVLTFLQSFILSSKTIVATFISRTIILHLYI